MKQFILFAILTAILSGTALAKATAKGEVETDCPWSKQDERSIVNKDAIKDSKTVAKKKKVGIQ